MLDLATWSWEPVVAKGGPSARSGHRMAVVRDRLLVFGGFFDNLREVKYYNDLHMFDLKLYKWTKITPQPGAPVPAPRSGFQLCSDGASGMYMYGGYYKSKVVMQQFDSRKDKSQVELSPPSPNPNPNANPSPSLNPNPNPNPNRN